ncbi:MAG: serine--tRNA ligase [Bacteroidetes bacterium GWE2_41_25]|nr:MAG: serine--tRNA ligase [Bacteroidetes bacterium GWA2_40_15]OFX90072.1 MAG: serine--tRNA ligase [Bacteroidetes bacterium GWC2_40_22]OFX95068.1 MAG: serine--tRNA ligase [Bacteroidetes bacterium GWE2_41_25]OFY58060.1 MAG: serine--tRNA ligase [Bacteroidetes bacterium GWF2_41_9]HAM09836.1 serine--tRNA ligase [Bacteroidales bacterium]
MLTINQIRENKNFVIERLKVKNFKADEIIGKILLLDSSRREIQTKTDSRQNEMNIISKEIGELMKYGKREEAEAARQKTYSLKEEIKVLSDKIIPIENELKNEIIKLPNLPHKSVPHGKSAEENVTVLQGGIMPEISDKALPHWDLIKKYDIIDFDLGIKLTGAGFPVYLGKGAKLQRALISFFLDEGVKAGYREVIPPIMVNEDSGFGTGQLPDKEGQMYHATLDNFYLIPTAEVPVTNIYRDVIMNAEVLPVKNIAYTPCFRREAGSWGAHVRGLNRLHQFDKVEIVQIAHPDFSYESLNDMVNHVESLVARLDLPYRIIRLCGGDMSFTSALTYDFEVWAAAQKRWLEVSSVSNFESFQANRLKCRFKEKGDKQTKLVHTLNGSALALPRIVAAILENNQTEEGIKVPKVLVPYTGFDMIN